MSSSTAVFQELLSKQLKKWIVQQNAYDTEQEEQQRAAAIDELRVAFAKWTGCNCWVELFGSVRLGAHLIHSDIDVVCMVPAAQCEWKLFFTEFAQILKLKEGFTSVVAVTTARTPLLKVTYKGIDMDILLCRVASKSLPLEVPANPMQWPKCVDSVSARALTGPIVAETILSHVPDRRVYVEALRAIKYWASKRCIYGHMQGYLGGMACALLTAFICQVYPTACVSETISKFFYFFRSWKWANTPVVIECGSSQETPSTWHTMAVWTPSLTSATPAMNATHNVSKSTLRDINDELKRGNAIVADIYAGKRSWCDLFEPYAFTKGFDRYIAVICAAQTVDALDRWSGHVNSKLRHFIDQLARVCAFIVFVPVPTDTLVYAIDLRSWHQQKCECRLWTRTTSTFPVALLMGSDPRQDTRYMYSLVGSHADSSAHQANVINSIPFRVFWIGVSRRSSSSVQLNITEDVDTFINDAEGWSEADGQTMFRLRLVQLTGKQMQAMSTNCTEMQ